MKRILFVCLCNICRSSSAEEVMRTLRKKKGLEHEIEVDSAGILSYHRGELPDSRMRMHASRRGYNPVSYTHLDVYKRQVVSRSWLHDANHTVNFQP